MTTRDAFRAALATFLFTFLAVFGLSLAGWLTDVLAWAQDNDGVVVFPNPGVLVKAAVAAIVGAAGGLVNFVVRWAQGKLGVGSGPIYRALTVRNAPRG